MPKISLLEYIYYLQTIFLSENFSDYTVKSVYAHSYKIKTHVETITINVLSHKFLIQAKTESQLEDWFKYDLSVHLWYLKRI
jgi:hypothetical protein